MKSLILHLTCLYAAIILMMAGMMQYSHHHHHIPSDTPEIVFNCSAHACHHHSRSAQEESESTLCALHLAQMDVKDEAIAFSAQILTYHPFDIVADDAYLIAPVVTSLLELDDIRLNILLRSKIFNDYAFTRGSPAAALC